METEECMEELEEKLWEVVNIMQLVKETVKTGQEDVYIIRSISAMERMVKSVCENDIPKINEMLTK